MRVSGLSEFLSEVSLNNFPQRSEQLETFFLGKKKKNPERLTVNYKIPNWVFGDGEFYRQLQTDGRFFGPSATVKIYFGCLSSCFSALRKTRVARRRGGYDSY